MFRSVGRFITRFVNELGAANTYVQVLFVMALVVIVLALMAWLFDLKLMHPLSTQPPL